MAEWKSLTEQEKTLARAAGLDPEKESLVVNRVSKDQLVFLRHRDRKEVYVRLEDGTRGRRGRF